jgi:DNA polymerase III sliding clamp (beta) subunit (PCNA family)
MGRQKRQQDPIDLMKEFNSEEKGQGMQVNRYDLAVVMNEMKTIAKGQQPLMEHVYLSSNNDGELTIIANDLEVALVATLRGKGKLGKPVCLPASTLNKVVKGAKKGSDETVDLTLTLHNGCSVHVDGMATTLQGMSPEDFLNEVGGIDLAYKYPIADLASMRSTLDHVLRSVSTDTTRYIINHVLLNFDPDELVAVSTDGHRLHLAPLASLQMPLPRRTDLKVKSVLTPKLMLATAVRVIAKEKNGSASFEFDEDHVSFRMLGDRITWDIISKRVMEVYPQYKQVVPEEQQQKNVATILHAELEKATKRMIGIGDKIDNKSIIELNDGEMTISSKVPAASTTVNVQQLHRRDKKHYIVGVNLKYVADALRAKRDTEILFTFADSLSPIVIELGDGFKAVIMPICLTGPKPCGDPPR